MKQIQWLLLVSCFFFGSPAHSAPDTGNAFPEEAFQALEYRMIGPFRGGRVTAVTGVPEEPYTFYMGSTGGGLWVTEDAGETWDNVTDGQIHVGSIGAVAVAPSDRNVIYLGTGSSQPRGNVSIGDGIYKSLDAGKTWKHIGLPKAGLISRIRIHPTNPDLLYAAVMGNIFGPNPERGVYRSRDGGAHWEKVHYISEETGCVDLVLDVTNPRVLYAGFWRVERKPWTLIDGGEEGGVFKSTDGGDSWERLEEGLPAGPLGRVGVAVSPANPERVWVIQEVGEVGKGGVFRSDDGGKSFERVNGERKLLQRHWYYTRVYANPADENTVYVVNTGFYKSTDGGQNFERIPVPHGDNHDLWINPKDPDILIESNDGGANVSLNGGKTWSTQYNQPTAEMYRLTVDHQFPYRVYGCQQDNTSISVPSWTPGGLSPKQHWLEVGGGESGHIAVRPDDPSIIYAGNYIGQITRLDLEENRRRDIVAYPQLHDGVPGKEIRYRFQWNAPIRLSPHDFETLYHCSQHVHRSRDGGQSWEVISPDLTTNNPAYQEIPGGPIQHDHTGVELYTTIFAFEESPHEAGLFWVGTDDGLVHISRDEGRNWEEITPAEMPEGGTVNMIELSPHEPSRAFIAVYKYRENDFSPYIFRTNDYGKNWTLISRERGIPSDHFVRVVREDPDRKGLLYAGTEFGVYISFDDGARWQEFQLNLPATPVTDMAVHRQDLVLSTQGRSFWVLDDITPLHELREEVLASEFHLFTPRPAYRTQMRGFRGDPAAPESPPNGALIRYFLADHGTAPEMRIEILDEAGEVIRTFTPESKKEASEKETRRPEDPEPILQWQSGLNAFTWDMRYPEPHLVEDAVMSLASTGGPVAPPGTYQVRLQVGEQSQSRSFEVRADPRWSLAEGDLREQFQLTLQLRAMLQESHDAIRTARSLREQALDLARRADEAGRGGSLGKAAEDLKEKLTEVEEALIQTKNESGQDPINFPPRLDNQIAYLYDFVNSQDARPTEVSYERAEDLRGELDVQLRRLESIVEVDVEAFNQLLETEEARGLLVPAF